MELSAPLGRPEPATGAVQHRLKQQATGALGYRGPTAVVLINTEWENIVALKQCDVISTET